MNTRTCLCCKKLGPEMIFVSLVTGEIAERKRTLKENHADCVYRNPALGFPLKDLSMYVTNKKQWSIICKSRRKNLYEYQAKMLSGKTSSVERIGRMMRI